MKRIVRRFRRQWKRWKLRNRFHSVVS
jgi:hypothetical protein